ncbi:MAG: SpoIID/LytB domain-containing protein [Elusimicrobia bacterium]|nr:SpoIID/LytB domain-containing protein [Elusimicrobiota bacterium]
MRPSRPQRRARSLSLGPLAFATLAIQAAIAPPSTAPASGPASCIEAGSSLFRSGRLTQAAATFSSEACIASAGAEALLNAAIVHRDLGQDPEALRALDRASGLAAPDADALSFQGRVALRAGDPARAEKAQREALALSPGHPDALLGLARIRLRGGDAKGASALLEELTEASPAFSLGWFYLGRARDAAGRPERAAEAYRRTTKTDWTFSEARLPLAGLYRRMGRLREAWGEYARVLLIDPRHALAKRGEASLSSVVGRNAEDVVPRLTLASLAAPRPSPPDARMPAVRVGVGTSALGRPILREAIALRCAGPCRVTDPETGRMLAAAPAGSELVARRAQDGRFELSGRALGRPLRFTRAVRLEPVDRDRHTLVLRELRVADGYSWSSVRDRQLKGNVELRARGRRLYPVNELPLEDYLYGVVTQEMPDDFPEEAQKAQAVIARTHALYLARHAGRHRRDGYDACDGQHCQVYAGIAGESPRARAAAEATRGVVLRHRGKLAHTIFTSNCGGHTQDSGELQGWTSLPYLRGRLDGDASLSAPRSPWELERWLRGAPASYCSVALKIGPTQFRWTRAVPADELERRVNRIRPIGRLRRMLVVLRSRSGHANEVWVEGSKDTLKIKREHTARNLLGLASLRSTLFTVETERDPAGRPVEFLFYGGGWGHGVGLCQYGAAGRALAGQGWRRILSHYYHGTSAETLAYGAP